MLSVKQLWDKFAIWYGWKDAPRHFIWERYPKQQQIETNVQFPAVQIQPVRLVSVRERAQFHKMRLEVLQDESWLNSKEPVNTGSISIDKIQTQPVERDTDITLEVPALSKLIHERYDR
jgi:hypothetical protein